MELADRGDRAQEHPEPRNCPVKATFTTVLRPRYRSGIALKASKDVLSERTGRQDRDAVMCLFNADVLR